MNEFDDSLMLNVSDNLSSEWGSFLDYTHQSNNFGPSHHPNNDSHTGHNNTSSMLNNSYKYENQSHTDLFEQSITTQVDTEIPQHNHHPHDLDNLPMGEQHNNNNPNQPPSHSNFSSVKQEPQSHKQYFQSVVNESADISMFDNNQSSFYDSFKTEHTQEHNNNHININTNNVDNHNTHSTSNNIENLNTRGRTVSASAAGTYHFSSESDASLSPVPVDESSQSIEAESSLSSHTSRSISVSINENNSSTNSNSIVHSIYSNPIQPNSTHCPVCNTTGLSFALLQQHVANCYLQRHVPTPSLSSQRTHHSAKQSPIKLNSHYQYTHSHNNNNNNNNTSNPHGTKQSKSNISARSHPYSQSQPTSRRNSITFYQLKEAVDKLDYDQRVTLSQAFKRLAAGHTPDSLQSSSTASSVMQSPMVQATDEAVINLLFSPALSPRVPTVVDEEMELLDDNNTKQNRYNNNHNNTDGSSNNSNNESKPPRPPKVKLLKASLKPRSKSARTSTIHINHHSHNQSHDPHRNRENHTQNQNYRMSQTSNSNTSHSISSSSSSSLSPSAILHTINNNNNPTTINTIQPPTINNNNNNNNTNAMQYSNQPAGFPAHTVLVRRSPQCSPIATATPVFSAAFPSAALQARPILRSASEMVNNNSTAVLAETANNNNNNNNNNHSNSGNNHHIAAVIPPHVSLNSHFPNSSPLSSPVYTPNNTAYINTSFPTQARPVLQATIAKMPGMKKNMKSFKPTQINTNITVNTNITMATTPIIMATPIASGPLPSPHYDSSTVAAATAGNGRKSSLNH